MNPDTFRPLRTFESTTVSIGIGPDSGGDFNFTVGDLGVIDLRRSL